MRDRRASTRLLTLGLAVVGLVAAVVAALALVSAADDEPAPSSLRAGLAFSGSSDPWRTDFSVSSVPLDEIHRSGPARDAIPALDDPPFVDFGHEPLSGREPVVALELNGDARAYPISILLWHEIINHTVGGEPVLVSFCPLCHSAVAYRRELDDEVLEFGNTGNLRFADLIMYDRGTESWWQQFTGEAIVGARTGRRLDPLPASIVSLDEFRRLHPDGRVLSLETGFDRPYGSNPFGGYDGDGTLPFQLPADFRADGRIPPKERVVSVASGDDLTVATMTGLRRRRVVNDRVGATPIVISWRPGAVAALDAPSTDGGREVGSVTVFDRRVDGRRLTFVRSGDSLVDRQTRSRWAADGVAKEGLLAGRALSPIVHDTPFWFAVAALAPRARIVAR